MVMVGAMMKLDRRRRGKLVVSRGASPARPAPRRQDEARSIAPRFQSHMPACRRLLSTRLSALCPPRFMRVLDAVPAVPPAAGRLGGNDVTPPPGA